MADEADRPEHIAPPSLTAALRARAAEAIAFHPREIVVLAVLAVLVVSGAGLAWWRARPASAAAPAPMVTTAPSVTVAPGAIFVHVVGAVRRPGVYELADGARVVDAIEAAGGLARKADTVAVNMARALSDGEQVVVPRRAPPGSTSAGPAASDPASTLININTATAAELETLPGIGEVLAQRIIDYREQHGPFSRPEDLQKVSGIGVKTFESIAAHITV